METQSVAAGLHQAASPGRLEQQKIREVAQEFEAILISVLLKGAQSHVQGGPLAGGLSHDLYQQLFTDEIAKTIARSGGIGLGKMLERQLQKMLPPPDPAVNASDLQENQLKINAESADSSDRRSVLSRPDR